MIVCVCHRVSDRDIAREAAAGCPDFVTLQDRLRVASTCGRCREAALDCFAAQSSPGPRGCPGGRGCGGAQAALAA